MTTIGTGVEEIRVHTEREHRVFYIARFEEGVYVLHTFEKRSRTTPTKKIEVARIGLFSADTLIDMLARLGIKVRVVTTARKRVA